MKYNLSTQHTEVSETDREMLEKKLSRLKKHLSPPFQIDVRLTRDTHHQSGDVITCRINVEQAKVVHHAERSGDTIQDALDATIEAIDRELSKHHGKRKDSHL